VIVARHVAILMSFAYKPDPHAPPATPPRAHQIIDIQHTLRPGRTDRLRELTGLDKEVQDFVGRQHLASETLDMLVDWVRAVHETHFGSEDELRIAIGCKSGRHRSVAMIEALAVRLKGVLPSSVAIRKVHMQLNPD